MKFETRPPEVVEIGGKTYQIKKPTVGHIEQMLSGQNSLSATEKVTYIRDWLAGLGLPKDVSAELYMDQLTDLMEELTGAKKKSPHILSASPG